METEDGKAIDIKKALLIFVLAAALIIAAGFWIGEAFFWNQYDVVNPIDKDIAYLENAVAGDKNNDKLLVDLGWLYYRQGNYEKSIDTLNKAIQVNKLNPAAHYNLGVVYEEIRLLDKAAAEFQKSIQLEPDSKVANFSLGKLYYTENKWDDAIEQFKSASANNPVSADNYYWLGMAYKKKGYIAEAKAAFAQVLKMVPNDSKAKEEYYRLK